MPVEGEKPEVGKLDTSDENASGENQSEEVPMETDKIG